MISEASHFPPPPSPEDMASISYILSPHSLIHNPTKTLINPSAHLHFHKQPTRFQTLPKPNSSPLVLGLGPTKRSLRLFSVAETAPATSADPSLEAARRVYIGNIPRDVDTAELTRIVGEHGAVDKAEVMYDKYSGRSRRFAFVTTKTIEDANIIVEKLNGTEIKGRKIKVNITEKPLTPVDVSLLQAEETQFLDSPNKVYVGNLAKTVTTDILKSFFSEKGKVLGARVSRELGTSKSRGFGFVTFSSDKDAEAAITFFNNTILEGQKIRVNKA